MWHKYAFNKLVRSFILDKEEGQNKTIISYKILSEEEYRAELINKFHEEALEVVTARDKNELIAEIGDCYEVIDEILKTNGISKDEVLKAQSEKRERKGGFGKRIFINSMQYDEKNPLHEDALGYIKDENQAAKYELIGKYNKHIVDFIITNEAGQIYIQKRCKNRKSFPNYWEFPGGTLEMGEILLDCVKRELKEELNLEFAGNNGIIYETSYEHNGENHAYTCFAIQAAGWENFKLEEGKADEFKWISKSDIEILLHAQEKTSPTFEAAKRFFGV